MKTAHWVLLIGCIAIVISMVVVGTLKTSDGKAAAESLLARVYQVVHQPDKVTRIDLTWGKKTRTLEKGRDDKEIRKVLAELQRGKIWADHDKAGLANGDSIVIHLGSKRFVKLPFLGFANKTPDLSQNLRSKTLGQVARKLVLASQPNRRD
jgi:hypothetical protein